jgi:hypothetical protein
MAVLYLKSARLGENDFGDQCGFQVFRDGLTGMKMQQII